MLLTRTPILIAAALALTLAACGDDAADNASVDPPAVVTSPETTPDVTDPSETTHDEMSESSEATHEEMGDVLAVAMERTDLSTFIAALGASGGMDGFHGDGPFTIFAPTNDAFTEYLGMTGMAEADLLADPAGLTALLNNHVVTGDDTADMVMAMADQSFTSLAGNPLAVTVNGDIVMINDATVLEYDLHASNGVIHVIDHVLAPPAG